jgi:hypothetical protein
VDSGNAELAVWKNISSIGKRLSRSRESANFFDKMGFRQALQVLNYQLDEKIDGGQVMVQSLHC